MYLGADEQTPGLIFWRLFDPTDFDQAWEAINEYIKTNKSFLGEFNILGLFGGKSKDFLRRYIQVGHDFGLSYDMAPSQYRKVLKNKYGYSDDKLDIYFEALTAQYRAGKVKPNIYNPASYTPSDPSIMGDFAKKAFLYGAGGLALYFLGKEILFKKVIK
jgi:hypothetical protein